MLHQVSDSVPCLHGFCIFDSLKKVPLLPKQSTSIHQPNVSTNLSASIYLFKVNNGSRAVFEIGSKLTMKTPQRRLWCLSDVFVVIFEQISEIFFVVHS